MAALAARQFGRVRYDQLRALFIAKATITAWRRAAYLHLVLPRVYAVGHPGASVEADLAAAVLYAGPGAMLSHATAVWWLGLLNYPPPQIHVSSPRRVRSREDIAVHGDRRLQRSEHRGLPVTTPSQAILDFAATGDPELLRLVLANAEYHNLLDVGQLHRIMGRRIPGTAALRHKLAVHLPQLARTRSDGEVDLVIFCQRHDIPIPEVNVYLHGHLLDALWRDQLLVVEVDGHQGHRTPAQLLANHQRDLTLRGKGLVVLRYAKRQFADTPAAVGEDVLFHLAREL